MDNNKPLEGRTIFIELTQMQAAIIEEVLNLEKSINEASNGNQSMKSKVFAQGQAKAVEYHKQALGDAVIEAFVGQPNSDEFFAIHIPKSIREKIIEIIPMRIKARELWKRVWREDWPSDKEMKDAESISQSVRFLCGDIGKLVMNQFEGEME